MGPHQLELREKEKEMQAVLTMENVFYGKLQGVNLRIAPGECVALQDLDNAIVWDLVDLFQGSLPEKVPLPFAAARSEKEAETLL